MPSVKLNVYRGDATGGEIQGYEVETDPGMVVLDVVHRAERGRENFCVKKK